MTRALIPLALICATLALAAQAATEVPRLEDPPRTQVPRIEDAPRANVPRIDDARPTNVPRIQDPPPTHVPRLSDADDDLLPVESRQRLPEPVAIDPATKAGKGGSAPMGSTFTYDLVIGFIAQVPEEGVVTSYFFLDSRNGHFGMDRGGMESLGNAPAVGEGGSFDFLVFTNAADHYTYLRSAETGPVAIQAKGGQDALGADLEAFFQASAFEEDFRKTGRVRNIGSNLAGKPYVSQEYTGINPETGTPMTLWLAAPDFHVGFYAATYFGVGVIPLPKARQQWLVTRMEGDGAVFEISYVMRRNTTFSGAGYRDLGDLVRSGGR